MTKYGHQNEPKDVICRDRVTKTTILHGYINPDWLGDRSSSNPCFAYHYGDVLQGHL